MRMNAWSSKKPRRSNGARKDESWTRKYPVCVVRFRPAGRSPTLRVHRLVDLPLEPAHLRQHHFAGRRPRVWSALRLSKPKYAPSSSGKTGPGGNDRRGRSGGQARRPRKAKAAGIELVAFDRSGFRYHGRVKAFWPMPRVKPA